MKFISSQLEFVKFRDALRTTFAAKIGEPLNGDQIPGKSLTPEYVLCAMHKTIEESDHLGLEMTEVIGTQPVILTLLTEGQNLRTVGQLIERDASPTSIEMFYDDLCEVIGNSFNGSVIIEDSVAAQAGCLVAIIELDGLVFEQVAFACWVAKNLRVPLLLTPELGNLFTYAEYKRRKNAAFGKEDAAPSTTKELVEAAGFMLATDETGANVLVDADGNPAPPVPLELPEGFTGVQEGGIKVDAVVDSTGVAEATTEAIVDNSLTETNLPL